MNVDRYAEIYGAFRWNVPREFNIAEACCRRWSRDRWRFALYYEDESGHASKHTYWDIQQDANRTAGSRDGQKRGARNSQESSHGNILTRRRFTCPSAWLRGKVRGVRGRLSRPSGDGGAGPWSAWDVRTSA